MSYYLVIRLGFEPKTHSLEGFCKSWYQFDLHCVMIDLI